MPATTTLWDRYREHLCECPAVGLTLDVSRMGFEDGYFGSMLPEMRRAFDAMDALEAGEIANPTEKRRVGHYWLRAPALAPEGLGEHVRAMQADVKRFAQDVHTGKVKPHAADRFTEVLLVGIGGSALGPQLVADALAGDRDPMRIHFLDNTDPDGIVRTLESLGDKLGQTLVLVISKSGGTPETRNGMLETQRAFARRGLDFARHAVAVTGKGSKLDQVAIDDGWLARFPMWDWVGGRTSVTAAVGLLPAALQGIDIDALLHGAAKMDAITREHDVRTNPAARLALMWHHATNGRGEKDMVILPYKDRLELMSRYLQQLIMESLGKGRTLDGQPTEQGINVFGNKGSTDQHAYVQQLREGLSNFFVTFIVVQSDLAGLEPRGHDVVVDPEGGHTSGDYLLGFYLGTRAALHDAGRSSMTITLDRLDATRVGALIALYERAVGLYATLINVNAYDQPGVEGGKKAAAAVLDVKARGLAVLRERGEGATAEELASAIGDESAAETLHHLLSYLAANGRGVVCEGEKFKSVH